MKKTALLLVLVLTLCAGLMACGGDKAESAAAKKETAKSKEPTVELVYEEVQKYVDVLDDIDAAYLAEIKNTGDVPVEIGNISIDLENTAGELLTSTSLVSIFPDVINPGESGYIMESVYMSTFDGDINIDDIGKAILHYSVDEHSERETLPVEITEASITNGEYDYPDFTGRIENKGDEELTSVCISTPVRDANGKLQNVIFTIKDTLPAGEIFGFEQSATEGYPNMDYSNSTIEPIAYLLEY